MQTTTKFCGIEMSGKEKSFTNNVNAFIGRKTKKAIHINPNKLPNIFLKNPSCFILFQQCNQPFLVSQHRLLL